MPVQTDFFAYHKSIGHEFNALKGRIRNLIGNKHWQTDGEHKEAVLRNAIRSRLPETLHVGRGFVCYQNEPSTQLDILITNRQKPTLFKEGDLVIVTPDCAEAIIEVKTSQSGRAQLTQTLDRLARQVAKVRTQNRNQRCWAGLFIYEGSYHQDEQLAIRRSEDLINANYETARGDENRVVDCVAYGPDIFSRFWFNAREQANGVIEGPAWHSYIFNQRSHKGLAPAYFISNLIWQISSGLPPDVRWAFFPDPERGGKEVFRRHQIALANGQISLFPDINA